MRRRRFRILPTVVFALVLLLVEEWEICLLTLLAAFLHECGHMLAARLLDIPLRDLHMDFLGARLEVRGRMLSFSEEWLLAAAGPFVSLLFAALAATLWYISGYAAVFSCASLVLGLLNLLPIQGFDGGRMIETTLSFFCGVRVSRAMMRVLSFFFLFLLWASAVYFLLRAGDGLSLLFFSMALFLRFFDSSEA